MDGIHAEMAAIDEAARKTMSIQDADLYCMTFPCHLCARLIINAGIRNVFYIEPYPKSLAQKLFSNEIDINHDMKNGYLNDRMDNNKIPEKVAFIPFTGVAPRRYGALFQNKRRKSETGSTQSGSANTPINYPTYTSYNNVEKAIKNEIDQYKVKKSKWRQLLELVKPLV